MFPPEKPVNRRLNAKEMEEEIAISKIWGHIPRTHILDIPFYTNIPKPPPYNVNFDIIPPQ